MPFACTRLVLRLYKTLPTQVRVPAIRPYINQKKLASTPRSQCKFLVLKSGRLDSNQRPRAPQTCTLTGLSYAPNLLGIMALRRTSCRRSNFLSFLASAKLLNSYVPAKCFAHFFCVGGGFGLIKALMRYISPTPRTAEPSLSNLLAPRST